MTRSLTLPTQEIGWFDEEKNNNEALCTRLFSDTALVQGGTTRPLGTFLQVLTTLVTGFTIAFVYSWELSLVVLSIVPAMAVGAYFQMNFFMGSAAESNKLLEKANRISGEALTHVRTVNGKVE